MTPSPEPSKAELRQKALAMREAINALGNGARVSHAMATRLSLWPPFRRAKRVLAYAPFRGEADLLSLTGQSEEGQPAKWYLPVTNDDGSMSFFRYRHGDALSQGQYGILQPLPGEDRIQKLAEGDIILVPGLAFDQTGHRLGYGKGYYDRFLMQTLPANGNESVLTIGVAPAMLVWGQLPADIWDIPVGAILTENGILETVKPD